MSPRETGKQRAIRIPLDYYKRPDRLERWKLRLGGAALVAALAWPALGFVPLAGVGEHIEKTYARGPVTAVHATWEADCTTCHTPFAPIRGPNAAANLVGASHAGSEKCTTCHAGPLHHKNQTEKDLACASCHHDHRGRDASLVRVSDGDCTWCHADLAAHALMSTHGYKGDITRFAAGNHPDFKALGKPDPGRLKFNHQLHLTAGIRLAPDSKGPFTLADIADKEERKRYRKQQSSLDPTDADKTPVKLTCASCHVTDAGDVGLGRERLPTVPAAPVLPSRPAGAAMLPISYEVHCRACHPLTFERQDRDDPRSGLIMLRHRLPPQEIRTFLEGYYAAQALKDEAKAFAQFVPTRPLPGKLLDEGKKEQVGKLIHDKVQRAEKDLFLSRKACGECHYTEPDARGVVPKKVLPTHVPDIWFRHAAFDHTAHRAVTCVECHAGADHSKTNADVLLPHVDSCLTCHAPRSGSGASARGGARFDCVECHRYHNGDAPEDWNQPLPGLGAAARGVMPSR
jgi:hypothetical protein